MISPILPVGGGVFSPALDLFDVFRCAFEPCIAPVIEPGDQSLEFAPLQGSTVPHAYDTSDGYGEHKFDQVERSSLWH